MLDSDRCYGAVSRRDARFDGRFFTGVLTTGIYCRPICPARLPRRKNVRFFSCAAAAEEAGFRPCRRCRPEASPGTPAWLGTSSTVSRALTLIWRGGLDGGSVTDLADRVGVGARHLRRLFVRHLGASPIAVAQTRRVHFARRLLEETSLPMADVASASGFASLRRFNAAVLESFGKPPTALRHASRTRGGVGPAASLALRLPYRPPLDWGSLIEFLAVRATPGVEEVGPDAYSRTVELGEFRGTIEVRPLEDENALLLRVPAPGSRSLLALADRTRRLFDLGADPLEIGSRLGGDPRLAAALRRRPGLRVPGAWDGFELGVRAILGQQVTVRGATTLAGRLAERYGEPVADGSPGLSVLFPRPAVLAEADLSTLGMPAARGEAIRLLARAVRDGDLDLDDPAAPEEAVARLTALPGVGTWTAQYIAMRALGDPDAFPAGDLGLRRALAGGKRPVTPGVVSRRAENWRPWRAYAAMALWTDGATAPTRRTSHAARTSAR